MTKTKVFTYYLHVMHPKIPKYDKNSLISLISWITTQNIFTYNMLEITLIKAMLKSSIRKNQISLKNIVYKIK